MVISENDPLSAGPDGLGAFLCPEKIERVANLRRTKQTIERARGVFLAQLADGLSVTGAADLAVVGKSSLYEWRRDDPDFAQAWDEAIEAGTDKLEDEARRRAYLGFEKPLVSAGKVLGSYTEYSDPLLTLLLKGRRPSKFRENLKHEVSGPNGGPIHTKGEFDYDGYQALFGQFVARGDELALAQDDSLDEPLDSAHAD